MSHLTFIHGMAKSKKEIITQIEKHDKDEKVHSTKEQETHLIGVFICFIHFYKFVLKVGFPSANDCPASEFSRMDFDSDEEFIVFHSSKSTLSHILLYLAQVTLLLLEL